MTAIIELLLLVFVLLLNLNRLLGCRMPYKVANTEELFLHIKVVMTLIVVMSMY